MAEEFQPGQIVRLRSGSPDMTVEQYTTVGSKQRVRCVWFNGATRYLGAFVPETLMLSRGSGQVSVPETLPSRSDRVIPIRS